MLDQYSGVDANYEIVEQGPSTSTQTVVQQQPPPSKQSEEEVVCVGSIIKKCKKIAAFFHKSTKAANQLKNRLKAANLNFEALSQDVETRWNSTLYLIEKIYKGYDCITAVLTRVKHELVLLTPDELKSLPEIVACLEFFESTTSNLGAEEYPSISLIIPFTETLYSNLKEKMAKFTTSVAITFGKALLYFIEKKLWMYETQKYPA